MSDEDHYEPSPSEWVRTQVEQILEAGNTRAVQVEERPVVLLTMRGRSSGKVRKIPVMRVENDGRYAAVASMGGAPKDPTWAQNLRAHPDVELMDGTDSRAMRARELEGAERDEWWARAVKAYPSYAEYQTRTERLLPVFLLEPR